MVRIVSWKEATNTKINAGLSNQIFDLIAAFANYGFNRSHAAAYGVIGYQTAYLKAHYPHEFYSSAMNLDLDDTEKLAEFARDMHRTKLKYVGPDVNKSLASFSVDEIGRTSDGKPEKAIRWALAGIKGVGEAAMRELVKERDAHGAFKSYHDFIRRTAGKGLNKKTYENLVRAGAMDRLHGNRAEMLYNLDKAVAAADADEKAKTSTQASFFEMMGPPPDQDKILAVPEMPRITYLQGEYEVLGTFMSGHPISQVEAKLRARRGNLTLSDALNPDFEIRFSKNILIGALVQDIRIVVTKKGQGSPMGILTVSDPTGTAEIVLFPDEYEQFRHMMKKGDSYVFTCSIKYGKDDKGEATKERSLFVTAVEPLILENLTAKNAA